ncbi:TniQ family protein [Kitasatospora purpeofusca]|uniref:TniQ family protein n=1 Tax=Kitasatospora purpeofusca TaxID=67352 RepID=UPI00386AB0DA|nr:TniQ family protein [Kitasatospora purpeofusca]
MSEDRVPGRIWRPNGPLPMRVRPVAHESTGSFLSRLAAANFVPVQVLLDVLGEGTQAVDPQIAEVYLSRAALSRLAVMAGRERAVVQRMLPSLREDLLLPGGAAAWKWPWSPHCRLVRACELCAARVNCRDPAWLANADSWRVCVRHSRWQDDFRGEGPRFLPLADVPEVVAAQRLREVLERKAGGRAVMADGFHVAVYWWSQSSLALPVWRERARQVRLGHFDVRAAPLVVLPEAVALGRSMAAFERLSAHSGGHSLRPAWLAGWQERLESWGAGRRGAIDALATWLARHGASGSRGRRAVHDGQVPGAPMRDLTCLPWRLG